jgi:hypothetical protein
LTFEEKRRIVEAIVEQLVIGKDDVTIELCYLPSPSEMVAKDARNLTVSR